MGLAEGLEKYLYTWKEGGKSALYRYLRLSLVSDASMSKYVFVICITLVAAGENRCESPRFQ